MQVIIQVLGVPPLKYACMEKNRITDLLAKEEACSEVFGRAQILSVPHMNAMKNVEADILRTTFSRKAVICSSSFCISVNIHLNMGATLKPTLLFNIVLI